MYRSFTIKNFRCFDELTVEGMGRINLIAGKNNVGKTALLEALWVHSGTANPERALRLDRERGLGTVDSDSAINNLFFGFDDKSKIEICAQGDWGYTPRRLELSVSDRSNRQLPIETFDDEDITGQSASLDVQLEMDYFEETGVAATSRGWLTRRPPNQAAGARGGSWDFVIEEDQHPRLRILPCIFLRSGMRPNNVQNARRFSNLEIKGDHERVLQVMQEIEPDLKRLTVLAPGGQSRIYADVGLKRLIPIQLMGDGMSRILSLSLAIASAPGGIVLVDEIENGIHYTVMEKVWRAIGAFARSYDVQLFATTHSYECIRAACDAFDSDEEDELRLFRIGRVNGEIRAAMYDREMMQTAFDIKLGFI